jgi:hypothetical protein
MIRLLANRALDVFSRRYDYDVSYMRAILNASPRAFMRLHDITKVARHREAAPVEAVFAAKLVGAMIEDCGPCTELVVNLAREARMADAQIEAVLKHDVAAMSGDAALGFCFAQAIAQRLPTEDEMRDAVRASWGERGLIDLTYALQIGRLFPMIKAGLGYAKECRRVHVGATPVDVARRGA